MSRSFSGGGRLRVFDSLGLTDYPITVFMWVKLPSNPGGRAVTWEFESNSSNGDHVKIELDNTIGSNKISAVNDLGQYTNQRTTTSNAYPVDTWIPIIGMWNGSREIAQIGEDSGVTDTSLGNQTFTSNSNPSMMVGDTGDTTFTWKAAHVTVWTEI